MNAEEAAELLEPGRENTGFRRRAAIAIAILAMLLAVTSLGGQNATKDAINANIEASNLYAFFQAKNQRQTSLKLAADIVENGFLKDPAFLAAARPALEARLADWRATIARYESEPETGEGKHELLARAREAEARRDIALRRDPYFDYAEVLFQIAIVLISVSLVAEQGWLAFTGGTLGTAATLLAANGFLLLVELPGAG